MVVSHKGRLWQSNMQADQLVQREPQNLAAEVSLATAWNYHPLLNEMFTVPFHWEAMSSNVLPLSEYCNAMSNFYQSDLLSLWHVVTCCPESCVKPGARQLTDFSVLPCGVGALEGVEREVDRQRGVAGFRDRPFILKGLFTMVISAWGTGYNARYQGIKARLVQQAFFFFFSRTLLSCIIFCFLCVTKCV